MAFPPDAERNICSQPGVFLAPASEWRGAGLHTRPAVWSKPGVMKKQVLAAGGPLHEHYLRGRMPAFVGVLSLLCAPTSPAAAAGEGPVGSPGWQPWPQWDPHVGERGRPDSAWRVQSSEWTSPPLRGLPLCLVSEAEFGAPAL